MSETPTFPYETRLNVLYQPLEIVEEKALADACAYRWYNQWDPLESTCRHASLSIL